MPQPNDSQEKKAVTRSVNLVLRVSGYEEINGELFVKGKSLESGDEVKVSLAPSDSTSRHSIAQLRNGYKVKRDFFKLDIGGIVCMDKAVKQDDGTFLANWPTVMAHTAEETKYVRNGMFTFTMGTNSESGKKYGYAIEFASNPENYIEASDPASLYDKALHFAKETPQPAFIIRALKAGSKNGSKEVVGWDQIITNYNKAENRSYSPEETAERLVSRCQKIQEKHPGVGFNVVPARRYSVSSFILQQEPHKVEFLEKIARFYKDMEGNSIAKKTCVKVGGEDSVFINDLKIIDPYAPGIDPVYLAGFVPATDEPQTKMQDEGAVAPPETSSAADENAANPTEYATDEMDGFSGLEAPDEGLRP